MMVHNLFKAKNSNYRDFQIYESSNTKRMGEKSN